MRWHKREYLDLMMGRNTETQFFTELFGPLLQLEKEWRNIGVFDDEISMNGFNLDYVDSVHVGNTEVYGGMKPVVLEDNDEYLLTRDELGRRMKLIKASASIPLPLDHPVTTMDDWLKIKHLYTFNEGRITEEQLKLAKKKQDDGALIILPMPGGFDLPRQLLGEELLCLALFDSPEMIKDMLETAADTVIKVAERIVEVADIDWISVHEDMAGKSGPLVGPTTFDEFIIPYYRKVWDVVSQTGTEVFSQDSDGNMSAVIESTMKGGVNHMFPMEPAAGMDIVEVRKKYPELMLKGGLDKHALRKDRNAIIRELEYKLQPSMQKGGIAFGLDHRIPNGVSIENYRFYVKTAQEILGRPVFDKGKKYGWQRMAF